MVKPIEPTYPVRWFNKYKEECVNGYSLAEVIKFCEKLNLDIRETTLSACDDHVYIDFQCDETDAEFNLRVEEYNKRLAQYQVKLGLYNEWYESNKEKLKRKEIAEIKQEIKLITVQKKRETELSKRLTELESDATIEL